MREKGAHIIVARLQPLQASSPTFRTFAFCELRIAPFSPLFAFAPIVTREPTPRMSLAQHVSSTEGADREWLEPLIDEDFPLGRVLTYDPLPPLQVEDIADHVAAYKVSKTKRAGETFEASAETTNLHIAVQVFIAVLACWLASGIVFGFAALKPVLISENVYREQCTDDELLQHVEVCMEQDIR
jgi:hypothetical protein